MPEKNQPAKWNAIAKDMIQNGPFSVGAEIWARSGFRCEYCDAELLTSPQTYGFAQSDHILPTSKYPHLRDDFNNYAHTCGLCNQLKRNWDPNEGRTEDMQDVQSLSDSQREDLIKRCREHLAPLIAQKHAEIQQINDILNSHGLRSPSAV